VLAPQTHSGSKLDKELEQGLKLMCSHPFGVGGGGGEGGGSGGYRKRSEGQRGKNEKKRV